jgi:hypothetical protein
MAVAKRGLAMLDEVIEVFVAWIDALIPCTTIRGDGIG